MIDMYGEVGVGMGVVGLYGENCGWRGRGGRYSLRASNIFNDEDRT